MMSHTDHHEKYDKVLHDIYPLNVSDPTKNWLSGLGKKRIVPIAKPVNRIVFDKTIKEPFWQFLYEQMTGELIIKPEKTEKPKLVDRSKHPFNKKKLLIPQTLGVRGNAQTLALEKLKEELQILRGQLSRGNLKPREIAALQNAQALLEEALADIKLAITRAKNKRQTKTRQQGRGSR
jgi:hypothetical protein